MPTWRQLTAKSGLATMNEAQVLDLLEQEEASPATARRAVLVRLHQRYTRLRSRRERRELAAILAAAAAP